MNIDYVRSCLTGPLGSLRTPFNRDGSIDYAGVRHMIDFILATGCRTTLLTAGDSHFECMTNEEKLEMNRVCAEHTGDRGLKVGCDWQFGTPYALKFARECKAFGVDILMTRPADWANSATVQSLVDYFAAIGDVMPIMLVTNLFVARSEAFSMEVMRKVRDTNPNALAVKDDITNEFARKTAMLLHDKWAVFSGGGLRNHLNMLPYGCDGFMDRHLNFQPRISKQYWDAVQKNDIAEAARITREIEVPLEDHLATYAGGRDASVHGLLEVYGVAGRWRRAPYHSLTDAEMSKLKAFVKEMGIL